MSGPHRMSLLLNSANKQYLEGTIWIQIIFLVLELRHFDVRLCKVSGCWTTHPLNAQGCLVMLLFYIQLVSSMWCLNSIGFQLQQTQTHLLSYVLGGKD